MHRRAGSRWLWVWLACGLSLAAAARATVESDGFVLAGQSNMVGVSTQNENLKTGRVTSPSLSGLRSYSYRALSRDWVMANEFPCDDTQCAGVPGSVANCAYPGVNRTVNVHPVFQDQGNGTCVCQCGVHSPTQWTNADAKAGSAWPTFAARWMAERGREVHFVATALGGQALVAPNGPGQPTWNPDAMDCRTLAEIPPNVPEPSPTAPGELYCRMIEVTRQSQVTNLHAVLWLQGENDANLTSFDQYKAALESLGRHVHDELGVPLIVAPISLRSKGGDSCTPDLGTVTIHDATIAAAASSPWILLGPSTDNLELEPDCAHIHDVVALGNRWYDAVDAVLPACTNGLDDDGDGLIDYPEDPGCGGPMSNREDPACQDGIDNDHDGTIDFDGGASVNHGVPLKPPDPKCTAAFLASEARRPECGLGIELLPLALLARRRLT